MATRPRRAATTAPTASLTPNPYGFHVISGTVSLSPFGGATAPVAAGVAAPAATPPAAPTTPAPPVTPPAPRAAPITVEERIQRRNLFFKGGLWALVFIAFLLLWNSFTKWMNLPVAPAQVSVATPAPAPLVTAPTLAIPPAPLQQPIVAQPRPRSQECNDPSRDVNKGCVVVNGNEITLRANSGIQAKYVCTPIVGTVSDMCEGIELPIGASARVRISREYGRNGRVTAVEFR